MISALNRNLVLNLSKAIMVMVLTVVASVAKASDASKENSIYQIESKWTNQDGKSVQLGDFKGQPVIFAMVYLTCQYLCPTIISEVQNLEEDLPKAVREKTKVILLSFDPARDTVDTMSAYGKKRKLDSKKWSFLTGKNDSEVREVAVALNFKYQKTPDGEFSHSFMILALDKEGKVAARVDQAGQDKAELIKALVQAAK